jgi:hypothetical protein
MITQSFVVQPPCWCEWLQSKREQYEGEVAAGGMIFIPSSSFCQVDSKVTADGHADPVPVSWKESRYTSAAVDYRPVQITQLRRIRAITVARGAQVPEDNWQFVSLSSNRAPPPLSFHACVIVLEHFRCIWFGLIWMIAFLQWREKWFDVYHLLFVMSYTSDTSKGKGLITNTRND